MPATSIGFWRVLMGTVCLALWGLGFRRELFRVDARGWLLVGVGGGLLVALFEIAYQFAIAGAGVAGAAAMLYTAPVIVAVLARVLLQEALTTTRVLLALLVMAGVALTVTGGSNAGAEAARLGIGAGIAGGLLSALSYALTTLLARFAVPRYGAVRVLFLEALGGILILGFVLTLSGHAPMPPPSAAAWRGLAALTAGSVLAANFLFFAAVKGIEAAPAAGAALLATARRLHDPRLARHHHAHDPRQRDDPLHQQLARHTDLPLAAARPEHLSGDEPRRRDQSDRRPLRRPRIRGRLHNPVHPRGPASGPGGRQDPARDHRQWHGAAGRPRPTPHPGRAGGARAGIPLRGARARLGPHGPRAVPRRLAVRSGRVVSPARRL